MKHFFMISLLFAVACGSKTPAPEPGGGGDGQGTSAQGGGTGTEPPGDCQKGGCSGTMCVEPGDDRVTTCEWRPEYACYQSATCMRQPDGACGWSPSAELTACLANPPAE